MKTEKTKYASESEMCAEFADTVRKAGWKVFPEFAGFDLYLATPSGDHVGVEAKLRPNLRVLAQISSRDYASGPDFLAVLVPDCNVDFLQVAAGLSASVFGPDRVPSPFCFEDTRRLPTDRPELPLVEENRKAGCASPVQTTAWKQKAVRLIAMLDIRGHVTRLDIKHIGIAAQLWINKRNGWLVAGVTPGHYVADPNCRAMHLIRHQHPELLKAEIDRLTGGKSEAKK